MIDYFARPREGKAMLARHVRLSAWFEGLRTRHSFTMTDPGL